MMRQESLGLTSPEDFLDRLNTKCFGTVFANKCFMEGTMGVCVRCDSELVSIVQAVLKKFRFVVPYEVLPHGVSRWT